MYFTTLAISYTSFRGKIYQIFDGKTTVWMEKRPPIQHRLHFKKQVWPVSNLKWMGELLVYPSNPFYWFKKIFQCFWIWRKTHMHKSGRTYLSNQETQCNTKWKIHWQTFQKILFQNLNLISCISSKGDPVKTTKMKYQQNQEEAQKKMKLFSK